LYFFLIRWAVKAFEQQAMSDNRTAGSQLLIKTVGTNVKESYVSILLRVPEDTVLRRIFEPEREEVAGRDLEQAAEENLWTSEVGNNRRRLRTGC
jgi:hypothetical protein